MYLVISFLYCSLLKNSSEIVKTKKDKDKTLAAGHFTRKSWEENGRCFETIVTLCISKNEEIYNLSKWGIWCRSASQVANAILATVNGLSLFSCQCCKKTFFRTCPLPLSYCTLANVRFRWTMTRILWAKSKRNLTKHINAIISLKDMWLLFDVSILFKNTPQSAKRYKKLANILPLLLSMKI